MSPEFWNQLGPVVTKTIVGLVISGLLGVIVWPLKKAKKEWVGLKDSIANAHSELVKQRTNCLGTLQAQGETQIALLSKTVAALDGVRLDLAEQTGYLRASAAQPVRRRAAKK